MGSNAIELVIALLGGGALASIITTLLNKRNADKKTKADEETSIVSNTEKIREITAKLLEDQEKMFGEKMGLMRQNLQNEYNQKIGEVLVDLEEQKERNQDLKEQIAALGGYVQGVTGDLNKEWLIYQRSQRSKNVK